MISFPSGTTTIALIFALFIALNFAPITFAEHECYDCSAHEKFADSENCINPSPSKTKRVKCPTNVTHCAKFSSELRGPGHLIMDRCCSKLPTRKPNKQSGCHNLEQADNAKVLCVRQRGKQDITAPSPYLNQACFCDVNKHSNCNDWTGLKIGASSSSPLFRPVWPLYLTFFIFFANVFLCCG